MSRLPFAGKRIGVLLGGRSAEREISLRSGAAVAQSLKRQGYEIVEIDPDERLPVQLSQASGRVGSPMDVAFLALHGRGGEDGQIQAILEWCQIPYTGSGILASAVAMDKVMTKRLLMAEGIPTPAFHHLRLSTDVPLAESIGSIPQVTRFPVVVKPACEGSTVGITIVDDAGGLAEAVTQAAHHGRDVLIEEFIDGHELTVALLDGEPLPPIEIVPQEAFYNYEAKYTPGRCDYRLPPTAVAAERCREAQRLAVRVHTLLGCEGATRVDFRVDRSGKPFVLEMNTIPGMTQTSLLPRAAEAAGLDYDALVVRILSSATRRVATDRASLGAGR